MPTTRRRHTITETPQVEEALDQLRAELGDARIDFSELVILGARARARELRERGAAQRRARERLVAEVREGAASVDVAAADESSAPAADRMLLLDNSAWARRRNAAVGESLAGALESDDVAVCLPFLLEAGYSARSGSDYEATLPDLARLDRDHA